MDTSLEYVEMCAKAEEIQKLRLPNKTFKEGDWWISKRWGDAIPTAMPAYRGSDEVWLPRQDQLQAMILAIPKGAVTMAMSNPLLQIFALGAFCFDGFGLPKEYPNQFTSTEQLWFALVMSELYGKIWDSDKKIWRKGGKDV